MEEKIKILFVEDNRNAALAAKVMLELRGYAVDTAESVAAARELLQANPYHLLISDLELPDGSGHDLVHQTKVPAIALSGYTTTADRENALKNGFAVFLPKPFHKDDLIRTIEELAK